MKPIMQTKLHDPPKEIGNCMEACFASLLEIGLSEVPEFIDKNGWYEEVLKWLHNRGYHMVCWDGIIHCSDFCIAVGDSPRGDFQHCVIYKNNEMVHDPHPSGYGLKKINQIWVIQKLEKKQIEAIRDRKKTTGYYI